MSLVILNSNVSLHILHLSVAFFSGRYLDNTKVSKRLGQREGRGLQLDLDGLRVAAEGAVEDFFDLWGRRLHNLGLALPFAHVYTFN